MTDETGRAYLHSRPGVEFTFSPDPAKQPQAHEFTALLRNAKVVVQTARKREIDDKVMKYVGVRGVDKPRIVQVGVETAPLLRIQEQVGLKGLLQELLNTRHLLGVRIIDARQGEVAAEGEPVIQADGFGADDAAAGESPVELERAALAAGEARTKRYGGVLHVVSPIRAPSGEVSGAVHLMLPTGVGDALMASQVQRALAAAGLSMIPMLALALFLVRSIAKPIQSAVRAAERVAEGDLTVVMPAAGKDEVGRLLTAMAAMGGRLRELLSQIKQASDRLLTVENASSEALGRQTKVIHRFGGSTMEVAAAAAEIAATSNDLVKSTSQAAETASQA
ncbi:MAG: HAMP domain-containing protein, partial [Planctomycetia bacterium]